MRSEALVRDYHDLLLRNIARAMEEDRDTYRDVALLDVLCWTLEHGYCVSVP